MKRQTATRRRKRKRKKDTMCVPKKAGKKISLNSDNYLWHLCRWVTDEHGWRYTHFSYTISSHCLYRDVLYADDTPAALKKWKNMGRNRQSQMWCGREKNKDTGDVLLKVEFRPWTLTHMQRVQQGSLITKSIIKYQVLSCWGFLCGLL